MTQPVVAGWLSEWRELDGEEQLHITPEGDLVEHEQGESCVCGPYAEHLGGKDWLYAHWALDGRE